jgi:cell division inhibitor SepF
MPGAMHRMGVYLGLVEDDEYADVDGYGPGPDGSERAVSRRDDYVDRHYSRDAVEPTRYVRGFDEPQPEPFYDRPAQPSYQITALHPRSYNDARIIGEHFRKNTPVIMNLSDMEDADAKRLVDFAAGLIFGLHGSIDRVTTKVFLLTPQNVSVTEQDKARIESGFFNQS